jgi:hypothetical protein
MKGFIEVKEDQYEDAIEHLYRIKNIACKLIKKLAENSEVYNKEDDGEEDVETVRIRKGRYIY